MPGMNITDALTARARRMPDAIAVLTPSTSVTYAQLDAAVWQACARLRRLGIAPDHIVGLSLAAPLVHVVATLALARLGVAQLPLPLSDPAPARAAIARRLGLAAVIGDRIGAAAQAGVPVIPADPGWLQAAPGVAHDPRLRCDDPLRTWQVTATSGTTGEAKLGLVSHATGLQRAEKDSKRGFFRDGERMLLLIPLHFRVSTVRVAFTMHAGTCLCLPEGLREIDEVLDFVETRRIGVVSAAPVHGVAMAQAQRHEAPPRLRGVRVLQIGGSSVGTAMRRLIRSRLCDRLYVQYGSNEAGSITVASPELQDRLPETVGTAVPGMQIQIVDTEGRPLPAGEVGEIRVRGPGIIDRYLDDPAADARAFRDGWFHQGDRGALDEHGALTLHGRSDDMINLDGINIYPAEIERALLQHPAVAEASAFGLHSEVHQHVPAAAVVLRHPLAKEELLAHARQWLGAKAPRALLVLAELPRDPLGKVRRDALARELMRRRAARPSPSSRDGRANHADGAD
jgi:long-chain acyl-CoA synthetase